MKGVVIDFKEELAYLLWTLFRIKSKWLCKKGYHFYQLRYDREKNKVYKECYVCKSIKEK